MPIALASSLTAQMLRALAFAGLFCLASCTRHLTSPQVLNDKANRKLDYFLLVRQWPGSYCSQHGCPLLRDRGYHFTIHGLWPNYDDGTWPQFCDSSYKFDEDKLEDIMDDLEGEWPSVFDSDETFWEHEWSKHGTCALGVFPTEHDYFNNVLKMHRRYDLAAALRKADILPDKHKTYRSRDLADAIHDEYGVWPVVHCEDRELSEIWMCFGKDLRPFDCDKEHQSNTCEELIIPPSRGAGKEEEQQQPQPREEQAVQAAEPLTGAERSDNTGSQVAVAKDAVLEAGNALEAAVESGAAAAVSGGPGGQAAGELVGVSGGRASSHHERGSSVEDSIYWLLESDAATPLTSDTSAGADPAEAAAAAASAVSAGTAAGLGPRDVVGPGTDVHVDGAAPENSEPHDDAFPVVLRSGFAQPIASLQQQQLDLDLIEQRLEELNAQAGQFVAPGDIASNAGAVPLGDDTLAPGTGALAVLAALASRLQQRLVSVGGGGSGSGEVVYEDRAEGGAGDLALPQPNGGAAAAASGGAQGFMWTSKLRSDDGVAFSADEAEERASLVDGSASGAAAALAVVTSDGESGPMALWTVQRVLVLPTGEVGVGVGPAAAPPMWVVLLLAVQLICVVVICLSLVVVTGMALVGARWGAPGQQQQHASVEQRRGPADEAAATAAEEGCGQPQRRRQSDGGAGCWAGASGPWGARSHGQGELAEPLLLSDEEEEDNNDEGDDWAGTAAAPPKVCHANRDKSAAEEEDEEEREAEQRRRLARQQQQQGWHVNPLRGDLAPASVLVLPVAAAGSKSAAPQQSYAPVH